MPVRAARCAPPCWRGGLVRCFWVPTCKRADTSTKRQRVFFPATTGNRIRAPCWHGGAAKSRPNSLARRTPQRNQTHPESLLIMNRALFGAILLVIGVGACARGDGTVVFSGEKKQNNLVSELLRLEAIQKVRELIQVHARERRMDFHFRRIERRGEAEHSSRQRRGTRAGRPLGRRERRRSRTRREKPCVA